MSLYWLILLCLGSYFFGNINFAIVISNLRHKKDIRTFQSGNPGAMNMIRNFGLKTGLLILLLDALKGAIPAFIGFMLFGDNFSNSHIALFACGLAATIGHIFPVIYKFRGGKGVATTMGVFLIANPIISILVFIGCGIYLIIFEYGAAMSFIFITTMVIWQSLQSIHSTDIAVCILLCCFYFLSWYTHRANIARLLFGIENRAQLLKGFRRRAQKAREEKWVAENN